MFIEKAEFVKADIIRKINLNIGREQERRECGVLLRVLFFLHKMALQFLNFFLKFFKKTFVKIPNVR